MQTTTATRTQPAPAFDMALIGAGAQCGRCAGRDITFRMLYVGGRGYVQFFVCRSCGAAARCKAMGGRA